MVIKIYQREPTSQIFFSCGALRKINYRNDKNDAYIVIIEILILIEVENEAIGVVKYCGLTATTI